MLRSLPLIPGSSFFSMKKHLLCLLAFALLPLLSHSTIIYVKTGGTGTGTSWSNAFGNLQDALTASNPGDQVWIAQGVYMPPNTGNRTISFAIKPDVRIYGGFAGTETSLTQRDSTLITRRTILSGEVQGDGVDTNNVYNVVGIKDQDEPVYLNSLVVTKGYGEEIGGNHIPTESYGAAINVYHATVVLDHVRPEWTDRDGPLVVVIAPPRGRDAADDEIARLVAADPDQ